MQCHKLVKSDKLSDLKSLSIEASALYLLAAPKTPEAVRKVFVSRAEAGEKVTHRAVKMALTEERVKIARPTRGLKTSRRCGSFRPRRPNPTPICCRCRRAPIAQLKCPAMSPKWSSGLAQGGRLIKRQGVARYW